MDQRVVLRLFGHVEIMDEHHMTRSMLRVENGGWVRGRQKLDWMNGMKVALSSGGCATMHER